MGAKPQASSRTEEEQRLGPGACLSPVTEIGAPQLTQMKLLWGGENARIAHCPLPRPLYGSASLLR